MELLQVLLPSPNGLQLNDYEMDLERQHLALSVSSTQTPVEGLNNKLKMLKRQMFGRAG